MQKERVKRAVNSIEFFLNPEISGNSELQRQISDHLVKGDLVVIKDALQTAFAERMFACLDQFAHWKVYEGHEKHFYYHHHNIYDDKLYPADLLWCRGIFGSSSSKEFIQQLAQRDCAGDITLSASLYRPGDHSLPHDDFVGNQDQHRQIAFVWHLTKDWQAEWGGDFFWCRKNRYVPPSFNCLLLFRVLPANMHFVTVVSPRSQSKRLAISGWWTGRMDSEPVETSADDPADQKQLVEFI